MQAIAIASYGKPDSYDLCSLPTPTISKPDDVLIKVHAASINPVDVKTANGLTKLMKHETFPLKIGFDAAGTVAAIGPNVTAFTVGDEVYSRVPQEYQGTLCEYTLSREAAVAKKPSNLNFTQAAGVPLAALTALQCLRSAEKELGGLEGKTIFVTAGLGGTGHFALQLAKNVFGAGKIITTLSTKKIDQARDLLGDGPLVQLVDYTKEDVITAIGKHAVDYMFDTTGAAIKYLPIMKKGGVIRSISMVPSGNLMYSKGMTDIPFYLRYTLNFIDWLLRFWIGRSDIQYEYIFMSPDKKGLEDLSWWIGEGKVKPIIGRTASFTDIQAVREGCQQIYDGKGGVGKFVIELASAPR